MNASTVPISAQVLAWAREEAGFTQVELAERVQLDAARVEDWENAKSSPTKGQFSKLVKVLKRPSALFFLPEPPTDAGMPTSFRRAQGSANRKLSPKETHQIRWARRLQELTAWVLQDTGAPRVELNRYQTNQNPTKAAIRERSNSSISTPDQLAWQNPSVAFREWRGHLEEQGVLVMQLSMGKNNIRGFGAWNDYAPMVAVNTAYHPTARIFTLFHEVAHLLTRTDAACQDFVTPTEEDQSVERWCERYAATFLLPKEAVEKVAATKYGVTHASPTADADTARYLANRFSVSARAMAIRLQEIGLAVPALYSTVVSELAARDWNDTSGGGGGESACQKRIRALGTPLSATLFTALDRGRITTRDLADHLALNTGQLDDLKVLLNESR